MSQKFTSPFDTSGQIDPEVIANPYPSYHQLRTVDPVHWNPETPCWDLTRYADVEEVYRDGRMSVDRMSVFSARIPESMKQTMAPILRIFNNMMLMSDPPKHTRLRSLANKAFTPRVVENMRIHIQAIADQLIDDVGKASRIDVINDLAYPLPVMVICEMLGVASEDRDQFRKWADDLALFLGDFRRAAEHVEVAQRSALDMIHYLGGIIRECRQHPREDLISALVAAEDEGERFSEDELFSMFVLLQIAGHETTTNLIGNGMLALLQNPGQMQKLRDDPSVIETAVEEFLRFNSPIQSTSRFATEDVVIGGQQISKGDLVRMYIGAANRDPARFTEPDSLDITRQDNRHVALALGPHFCLGAALARLEGQIAIGAILRRLPGIRLESPLSSESRLADFRWRDNPIFHGLESLPVVLEPLGR